MRERRSPDLLQELLLELVLLRQRRQGRPGRRRRRLVQENGRAAVLGGLDLAIEVAKQRAAGEHFGVAVEDQLVVVIRGVQLLGVVPRAASHGHHHHAVARLLNFKEGEEGRKKKE